MNEKDVPAESDQEKEDARVPGADGNGGRQEGLETSPRKGTEETDRQ